MESTAKKLTAGRRQAERGRRQSRGDRRRLAQLLVSLALFLLVFAGQWAFPGRLRAWKTAVAEDTDFRTAFRQFSERLESKVPVGEALEALLCTLAGQEMLPQQSPLPGAEAAAPEQVQLLGETARHGLDWLNDNSFAGELPNRAPETQPEPEPEEKTLVTAVAQTYDKNGEKLPSNVSYEYYDLGLTETVAPVRGTVTSDFAYRISPITGKREFHLAMDIAAEEGTPIGAFADGTVRYIGESDEFGLYLMIDHDNAVSTFYAHCSKLLVRKGERVTCGQTVALVGHTGNATGAHLHLTILKDDIRLDPAYYVDPT